MLFRSPMLGRQPRGRRHGIGALAVELAAFSQFKEISEALSFPGCKFGIYCHGSCVEPEIIAQVARPSVNVMSRRKYCVKSVKGARVK